MAIYLKFQHITHGESSAEGHEGSKHWIEVSSLQFGAGRAISTPVGQSTKREASLANVSEVTCTKLADSTSPLLFQEAVQGKPGTVEIELTETGTASKPHILLKYKLTDAMVSSYSHSTGGDRPTESFALNFTKIEWEYHGLDHKGAVAASLKKTASFDLAKAVQK